MSTTIQIKNLSKHYKGFVSGLTKAVDDISLTINSGDLFFLLGPSGCGKTTLLRMIAGFIEPTSGSILFNGRDVARVPPAKRNTGMVFQSYALWPHMSVAQNVAFGLSVRKVPKPEREQRVMEALRAVRMDQYAKRKPNQLSGGQQQRVALARALVVRPEVLLLDEPLSNLDAKLRLEMRHEIKRICKESGLTTVYVTHDQKEALSMADNIAVLDMGVIAQIGTPRDLYDRPRTRFVADFLGETNFIEAKAEGPAGPGALRLSAPAGPLVSTAFEGTPPTGPVTCSIRPEAFRIIESKSSATSSATSLQGSLAGIMYLGDLAQYTIDLPGGTQVKVSQMHPTGTLALKPGDPVTLAVEPADVVIVR
jgi:iron(III) transport system ATP-binding protein